MKQVNITQNELETFAFAGVERYRQELAGYNWDFEFSTIRCQNLVKDSIESLFRSRLGYVSYTKLSAEEQQCLDDLIRRALVSVSKSISDFKVSREKERISTEIKATSASERIKGAARDVGLRCGVSKEKTRLRVCIGLTDKKSLHFILGYKAAQDPKVISGIIENAIKLKEIAEKFGHGFTIK